MTLFGRMKGLLLIVLAAIAVFRKVEPLEDHPSEVRGISDTAAEILHAINKHHRLANKTTPEMIISNGYPAEIHHVTTEDGYILELHRIPHGRHTTPSTEGKSTKGRPVAFLHHCLLCSSSDFIMNTPDKALAYLLADNGYDVWLANARGNTYSKDHVSLSPDEDEFWQFSWHEMGYYDLPAAIDYVLDVTGEKDIYYIGFSMGTTVFWVLMSERPEYATKIRFMVAMGPVAFIENLKGPLRYISWLTDGIMRSVKVFGRREVLAFGPVMDYIVTYFCDEEHFTSAICHNSLFFMCGGNPDQLNKEFLPVILSHTPAGTSALTIYHFLQGIHSRDFRMYDYGKEGNLEKYLQEKSPAYHLDRVSPPVAIFWGKNDWLATPKDVLHLLNKLPNVIDIQMIDDPLFTHLDFIWAINADELVYRPMLELLAKH